MTTSTPATPTELTTTAICDALREAAESRDLRAESTNARHILRGESSDLTIGWQHSDLGDFEPGWAWWLVVRDEKGYPIVEQSSSLDSFAELEDLIEEVE